VSPRKVLPLLLLPLLSACSDQRATFEIDSDGKHSLTLIRLHDLPWEKTAKYAVVATHMPTCMRRHSVGIGSALGKTEVYAPGNDAWILKQGKRMYVVETRTCEGFAKLDNEPEDGMGPLQGAFVMRDGTLVFVAAKKGDAAPRGEKPGPLQKTDDADENPPPTTK